MSDDRETREHGQAQLGDAVECIAQLGRERDAIMAEHANCSNLSNAEAHRIVEEARQMREERAALNDRWLTVVIDRWEKYPPHTRMVCRVCGHHTRTDDRRLAEHIGGCPVGELMAEMEATS